METEATTELHEGRTGWPFEDFLDEVGFHDVAQALEEVLDRQVEQQMKSHPRNRDQSG